VTAIADTRPFPEMKFASMSRTAGFEGRRKGPFLRRAAMNRAHQQLGSDAALVNSPPLGGIMTCWRSTDVERRTPLPNCK
jgi:hypothetical protein